MNPERGSGTVANVGVLVVAAVLLVAVLAVGQAAGLRDRAQAVADLAALAGADHSAAGGVGGGAMAAGGAASQACSAAGEVAERNAAVIVDCWTRDGDTYVVLRAPGRVGGVAVGASGRARAGPAEID